MTFNYVEKIDILKCKINLFKFALKIPFNFFYRDFFRLHYHFDYSSSLVFVEQNFCTSQKGFCLESVRASLALYQTLYFTLEVKEMFTLYYRGNEYVVGFTCLVFQRQSSRGVLYVRCFF